MDRDRVRILQHILLFPCFKIVSDLLLHAFSPSENPTLNLEENNSSAQETAMFLDEDDRGCYYYLLTFVMTCMVLSLTLALEMDDAERKSRFHCSIFRIYLVGISLLILETIRQAIITFDCNAENPCDSSNYNVGNEEGWVHLILRHLTHIYLIIHSLTIAVNMIDVAMMASYIRYRGEANEVNAMQKQEYRALRLNLFTLIGVIVLVSTFSPRTLSTRKVEHTLFKISLGIMNVFVLYVIGTKRRYAEEPPTQGNLVHRVNSLNETKYNVRCCLLIFQCFWLLAIAHSFVDGELTLVIGVACYAKLVMFKYNYSSLDPESITITLQTQFDVCPICHQEEDLNFAGACNHYYHEACILGWFRRSRKYECLLCGSSLIFGGGFL